MSTSKVPITDLGKTSLKVSKLGFGTVYLGLPQLNISPEEGGKILAQSHKLGINYWDTADDYGSHQHVASALRHLRRKEVFISTKTVFKNNEQLKKSLKNCLKELETDYIDIFMLHGTTYRHLQECHQALRELEELKNSETIKSIGLSTHSVAVVREVSEFKELDVVMAICCKADQAIVNGFPEDIRLEDGSIKEMHEALKQAHDRGKGVIAMKVLGMGATKLVENYQLAIKAVNQLGFVDAMVIGMRNLEEVEKNVKTITSD